MEEKGIFWSGVSIKEYVEARGGVKMIAGDERKTMLEAFRGSMPREFYCMEGSTKTGDRQSDAVVYTCESTGRDGKTRYHATGFHGRAQKPDFNFYYKTDVQRGRKIQEFFKSRRTWAKHKKLDAEKRKDAGRGLAVGDILRSSWGYDQTNVNYYQVLEMVGKTTVVLREIGQKKKETGYMSGTTSPRKDIFAGKPFRKQARQGSVKINSHRHAFKVDPKETTYWSSYH